MAVAYVNRKGQRYYLHQRAGQQGRLRYHFSQKTEGELAEAVPDGYEIYEHPNGQVFLRRQRKAEWKWLAGSEPLATQAARFLPRVGRNY